MNEFPLEILTKIFRSLPNRKEVALVNRRFYYAACAVDAAKICLNVPKRGSTGEEKQDYFRSILNTTRSIRNIVVNFLFVEPAERPFVIEIMKKFSEDIQYLKLVGEHEDFTEVITLVPNVEHLEIVLLDTDDLPAKKPRLDEEVLNLSRLKKLNIVRADDDFFNRLPCGVLTELTLHQNSLRKLAKLFATQTNIRKLTIVKDDERGKKPSGDADLFDNIRFEWLEWHASSFAHDSVRSILAKQIDLKTLKLIDGRVDEQLMNVIANQLSKLETLSLSVRLLSRDAIKSLSKLVNLKEITLENYNDGSAVRLQEFSELDNTRITTLNIQRYHSISNGLMEAIARSTPNLRSVSFHCDYNINTFHAILKNFNHVETLRLDAMNVEFDKRKGNYTTLMKGGCENDKLTELIITYPMLYRNELIKKMAKDYPHLKKLIILPTKNGVFWENSLIGSTLRGFKGLESLFILGTGTSLGQRIFDLELIAIVGKNLHFIALFDIRRDSMSGRMAINERVRSKFGVIKYSRRDGLKMSIDEETMERGIECLQRFFINKSQI